MPINTARDNQPGRKPDWLKVQSPGGLEYVDLKRTLHDLNLHTVCEEASCPNLGECWGGGTATVMILGDVCTRGCRFCDVKSGDPEGKIDNMEPLNVARALSGLDLKYVVITSVDRDDLPDGGASHFARAVLEVRKHCPGLIIETLIPDFGGERGRLRELVKSGQEVISHNLETVSRLTRKVRDRRASYDLSLKVLEDLKAVAPGVRHGPLWTKSSLMVGMGETEQELSEAMDDLRNVDVDFLTIGQYLQPGAGHYPVHEYIKPEQFETYRLLGEEKGFGYVASGPLVRSSYRAGEYFIRTLEGDPRFPITIERE